MLRKGDLSLTSPHWCCWASLAHANSRGIEYNNPFDVMGGGRTSAEDFGVGSKHAIWWISDSKIAFIDAEVTPAPAAPALNAYCCMSVGRPLPSQDTSPIYTSVTLAAFDVPTVHPNGATMLGAQVSFGAAASDVMYLSMRSQQSLAIAHQVRLLLLPSLSLSL